MRLHVYIAPPPLLLLSSSHPPTANSTLPSQRSQPESHSHSSQARRKQPKMQPLVDSNHTSCPKCGAATSGSDKKCSKCGAVCSPHRARCLLRRLLAGRGCGETRGADAEVLDRRAPSRAANARDVTAPFPCSSSFFGSEGALEASTRETETGEEAHETRVCPAGKERLSQLGRTHEHARNEWVFGNRPGGREIGEGLRRLGIDQRYYNLVLTILPNCSSVALTTRRRPPIANDTKLYVN